MSQKTGTLTKALSTCKTCVGFLCSKDCRMNLKTWSRNELLTICHMYRVSHPCGSSDEHEDTSSTWSCSHTLNISRISLQCVLIDEIEDLNSDWCSSHTRHICRVSLLCGLADHLEDLWYSWSSHHTQHICSISLLWRSLMNMTIPRSVGFLYSVDSLISLKTWGLTEVLTAHSTYVGFFSWIYSLIGLNSNVSPSHTQQFVGFLSSVIKTLTTCLTFVCLVSCMNFLMGLKVGKWEWSSYHISCICMDWRSEV